MEPITLMSKAMLQQRLLACTPRRGRPPRVDARLLLRDIHAWLEIPLRVLSEIAHKHIQPTDAQQQALSNLFVQWDRGELGKVLEGDRYVLRRVPRAPAKTSAPQARIDVSGAAPRIDSRKSWP